MPHISAYSVSEFRLTRSVGRTYCTDCIGDIMDKIFNIFLNCPVICKARSRFKFLG